jgi:hypothetical protein
MEFFTVPLLIARTRGGWHTLVPFGEVSYLMPYPQGESVAPGAFRR